MNKYQLKKIIKQNNLTLDSLKEAYNEVYAEKMLFDRIRGHFNGALDGKYKDVPDSVIQQLIDNLNSKDIIDWSKVLDNSIPITQSKTNTNQTDSSIVEDGRFY